MATETIHAPGTSYRDKLKLGAMMACKPCCGAGSGSGSGSGSGDWDGTYTDCKCTYENYQFNPDDPVQPQQPACGRFPTVIYYDCDTTEAGEPIDIDPSGCTSPAHALNSTVTSLEKTSYCTGSKRIVLRYCPLHVGSILFCGTELVPLYDIRVAFSSGDVITFRKVLSVQLELQCGECGIIEADTFDWPEGFDYSSWLGLEYPTTVSTATVYRQIFWTVVSASLTGGADTVAGEFFGEVYPIAVEESLYCNTPAFSGGTGGKVQTIDSTAPALVLCTDLFLKRAVYSGVGGNVITGVQLLCCGNNPIPETVTDTCSPTNERLSCPGCE